jgi:hypothetical protein
MYDTVISVIGTLVGTLLGVFLGYFLSTRESEKHFRRTVLHEIAVEYRRLANRRQTGGIQGLIRAGICQCKNNKEYAYVIDLVDDLKPEIEIGDNWRPNNGKYVAFFTRLRTEGMDPRSGQQMVDLKNRVDKS